jgi:hypothetical protein
VSCKHVAAIHLAELEVLAGARDLSQRQRADERGTEREGERFDHFVRHAHVLHRLKKRDVSRRVLTAVTRLDELDETVRSSVHHDDDRGARWCPPRITNPNIMLAVLRAQENLVLHRATGISA